MWPGGRPRRSDPPAEFVSPHPAISVTRSSPGPSRLAGPKKIFRNPYIFRPRGDLEDVGGRKSSTELGETTKSPRS
jgi:hypothetical protein